MCSRASTFFNPESYRIILFDQRGCGQSSPHCCLDENTTWELVDDIEAIRQFLDIKKFVLSGDQLLPLPMVKLIQKTLLR